MSDETQAPEVPVKTYTEAEVAEMVSGLKSKVDELLTEKKTAAQKAKDAEAARVAAEQESAKKAGELDKFEASLRAGFDKEKAELTTTLDALKSRVVGESKNAILGQLTGLFVAPEDVGVISSLVRTEFDGADVKAQFVDFNGAVITTDPAEFKKWMAKHPTISRLMKAELATGGGAVGAKGGAGGAGTIDRKQFDKLDHTARKQFFANGGKLID